ncbi:MAG: PEP-CTERM sorting domain-containing protein [Planctomycetota bacterium]
MKPATTDLFCASPDATARLRRYSAVAAAMGSAGLVGADAVGQVAWSGPTTTPIVISQGGSLFFDFDEDSNVTGYAYGAADLFVRNYVFGGGNYIAISKDSGVLDPYDESVLRPQDAGSFVGFTAPSGYGYASALSAGAIIDATTTTTDTIGGGTSDSVYGNLGYAVNPTTGDPTFFNYPATPTFIGFEFGSEVLGGTQHFGWLQVLASVPGGQLTIIDWAFETTPGAAILAGDTGVGLLISDLGLAPVVDGDANGDGDVDLLDFDILAGNFGAGPGAVGGETIGDFNGDGNVDLLDFDILAGNFGFTSPSAVPEPSAIGLLAAGGAGLTALRRRRRIAPALARRAHRTW